MTKSEFMDRIRQMQSQERSAVDIYADLALKLPDSIARDAFRALAQEEARHIAVEQEILALLQETTPRPAGAEANAPHGNQS
jgi:rubrerythrin